MIFEDGLIENAQIPVGKEKLGPIFVRMKDYVCRAQVYIFLAAYVSAMIFILIRFVP